MRRLALVLSLLAATTAACTSSGGPAPASSPALNATRAPLLPTNVYALPDVSFPDYAHLLRELRGTPAVVYVWGSWCGPCREDGPRIAAAARRYGRRVQFLGLDVKDEKGPARSFIHLMGWTFPTLFDATPTADVETKIGYFAQPVTLFYDRAGRVVDQISGPAGDAALHAGVRRILA